MSLDLSGAHEHPDGADHRLIRRGARALPQACEPQRLRPTSRAAVAVLAATLLLGGCAMAMLNGAASSGERSPASQPAAASGARTASQQAADDAISTAVRSKLSADPALKAFNLRVDTHDGVVTLRGEVAKVEQRNAAQAGARSVKGVRAVQNRVTVR